MQTTDQGAEQVMGTQSGAMVVFSWRSARQIMPLMDQVEGRPSQIVVIDPLASRRQGAATLLEAAGDVTLLEAVPTQQAEDIDLVQYSAPGVLGVSEPKGALRRLFPNLTERRRYSVGAAERSELIEALDQLTGPISVLIDMPGLEAPILDALAACAKWEEVERLIIRCGQHVLFEGALDAESAGARLGAAGFMRVACLGDDPDWPVVVFHPDRQGRLLSGLQSQLDVAQQQVETLSAEKEQEESARSAMQAERDVLQSRLDAAQQQVETLSAEKEQGESGRSDLQAERDVLQSRLDAAQQQIETLSAENQEGEAARAVLQAELGTIKQEQESWQSDLIDLREGIAKRDAAAKGRKAELDALQTERDEVRATLEQRTAAFDAESKAAKDELEAKLAAQADALQAAEADAADALDRRDAALDALERAQKLQFLAQADLKDLRERFAEANRLRAEHEALLGRLVPKLKEAQTYLQNTMQAEAVAALAAEKAEKAPSTTRSKSKKATSKGGKRDRGK